MLDFMATRARRPGPPRRLGVVLALSAATLVVPAPAWATTSSEPDLEIVSDPRVLTKNEVREADITDSNLGAAALDAARDRPDGIDVDRRAHRVYRFGDQQIIIDAATPLLVISGKNAAGEEVHDVRPAAMPAPVSAQAGYAVPPNSAWNYNNDGDLQQSVGTWYREMWWTINHANNYKACTTCPAYDYWRMYGKMRASSVTGSASWEGFKRAWLEFDRFNEWQSPGSYEPAQPEESYAGVANQTVTIGFKAGITIPLGPSPKGPSGTLELSYTGSMTRSTENWHPVIRTEIGSGGVQWCYYSGTEFTGTKLVTTRVGARTTSTGTGIGWYILMGQQDFYSYCPSQL